MASSNPATSLSHSLLVLVLVLVLVNEHVVKICS